MSSLDSQVLSRKERLAQLRTLKRKRDGENQNQNENGRPLDIAPEHEKVENTDSEKIENKPELILSRRNYDPEAGAPKQGFLEPPTANLVTVEDESRRLEAEALEKTESGEGESAQLDLTTLQPRPANWDIKQQLLEKLQILEQQTDISINRILRERLRGLSPSDTGGVNMPAGVDLNKAIERTEKIERV
ncbi:mRNA splicing factor [Lipomyces oligophaga]|uniref:mRNA splicing factor n=1 Tax=Lipomyces oligophaga TaxID=45792 RepID=UPI0034CEB66D